MDQKHSGDVSGHINTRMQHPCLMARLMGLESMPIARRKEPISMYKTCKAKELSPQKWQKPASPPPEPLRSKNRRAMTPPLQQQQRKLFSAEKSLKPHPKKNVVGTRQSRTVRDKCEEKVNVDTRNKNVQGRSVNNNMQSRSHTIASSRVKNVPEFGSSPSGRQRARAKKSRRGSVESEWRQKNSKHSIEYDRVRMEVNGTGPIECSDASFFTSSLPTTRDGTRFKNKEAVEKRRRIANPNHGTPCHKNTVPVEKVEKTKSREPNPRGNEVFVLEEIISMHPPHQRDDLGLDITNLLIHDKLQEEDESSTTTYSPFSILAASFSNDSSLSRSPYRSSPSSSGRKPDAESASFCNNVRLTDLNVDLLDSAYSLPNEEFDKQKIPSSLSENLMSNARLLLGSIFSTESDGMRFLFDTIDTVMKGLEVNESRHGGIGKLLFDCTIECIDLKYKLEASRYQARRESLAGELQDEIVKWYSFSGKAMNDLDLVWMDLSGSYGTWSRFTDEACYIGEEIENDILNELVEETVMHICNQLLRDGSCLDVTEGNVLIYSGKKH